MPRNFSADTILEDFMPSNARRWGLP